MHLGNILAIISTLEPLFEREPPNNLFHRGAIELFIPKSQNLSTPLELTSSLGEKKTHLIPLPLKRHSVNCLTDAPYTIYWALIISYTLSHTYGVFWWAGQIRLLESLCLSRKEIWWPLWLFSSSGWEVHGCMQSHHHPAQPPLNSFWVV